MKRTLVLLVLLLSSCFFYRVIKVNDEIDFRKRIDLKNTITFSFIEDSVFHDYNNYDENEYRLYTNVGASQKKITPIKVRHSFEGRVKDAFKKVLTNKMAGIVDSGGDFIIRTDYWINGSMFLRMRLYINPTGNSNFKLNDIYLISEKNINCKLSTFFMSTRWEKFFEAYYSEWKPEKYTEEVGVWLENALQKYLASN